MMGIFSIYQIINAEQHKKESVEMKFILYGILISLVLAIPSLSTTNWNHGQTVFSRYAYWLSIPIIFGFVLAIRQLQSTKFIHICKFVIVVQMVTVGYYGVYGKTWNAHFLYFKPISVFIMDNFPSIYNPIPEIFIERLMHSEKKIEKDRIYVYYNSKNNKPTKMLLHNEMAVSIKKKCPEVTITSAEGNWRYININSESKCLEQEHALIQPSNIS